MRLTVYLYPSVIFVDKSLLGRTMIERDASEFGKRPSLINFVGNHISIRRADGSLITTAVSPYPAVIYKNATANRYIILSNSSVMMVLEFHSEADDIEYTQQGRYNLVKTGWAKPQLF